MKNIYCFFIFSIVLLATKKSHAQYVTIPNPNFVYWLKANGYAGCMSGNMMDTTCNAVVNATSVICSNKSIGSLTGIEYFDNLQILDCGGNQLTSLPSLPNLLNELNCSGNQLTSLPSLPNSLTVLSCSFNQLTSLPSLPNSLNELYCYNNQLTSLPSLPNSLTELYCSFNQLTSLPSLPNSLIELFCDNNQLASIPSLPNSLTNLYCNDNQLTSLPSLPNLLNELNCSGNQLTSLPSLPNSLTNLNCGVNQLISLPSLPNSLAYIECRINQLTSLPSLPNSLTNLWCNDNQLTSLPSLPNSLAYLYCNDNQLTSLPSLPNSLTELLCFNNQLTSLPQLPDSLFWFHCGNNPNLLCLPKLKRIVNFIFTNTGVSCIPNYGNVTNSNPLLSSLPLCDLYNANGCQPYWNINGNTYDDINGNCINNLNEPKFSKIKIDLFQNGISTQSTYTNQEGNYSFDTDTGLFTIEIDTTNQPFTVSCPITFSDTAYLANADTMRENKNFALICIPGFDVGISTIISASGIFRPANFANVKILAGDMSNAYSLHCATGTSGTVQVTITGPATYIGAVNGALTPTVSGNVLTYTIADFGVVDFYNDFQIQVQTDTTAQLGQHVCFDVLVTPTLGDNNPENNTLTYCFTVVNSYDPNDKSVYPSGALSINDKELTYTIRFQNTGNAPAQHIYILDTLSTNLDVSTFELLAYSHQPQVQLIGNVCRFNFPNINLPDSFNNEPGSHGYVQYRVKLKDNLPFGTQIQNTAYIYFDFNPPVITNTVSSAIVNAISDNGYNANTISIFPNPTNGSITLTTKFTSNLMQAKIYDLIGKEIFETEINSQNTVINLASLQRGNYFLKVYEHGNLIGVSRVIKN